MHVNGMMSRAECRPHRSQNDAAIMPRAFTTMVPAREVVDHCAAQHEGMV